MLAVALMDGALRLPGSARFLSQSLGERFNCCAGVSGSFSCFILNFWEYNDADCSSLSASVINTTKLL